MRALKSAASVTASLALLIGVPWLLSSTIGNPLDQLPDLMVGDVNDHVVLAALAAALYVAWAQFAVAFVVELVSAVRRTPMPRHIPGVFAGQQGLARALVSGALLLLPVTAATVVPSAQALALTPGFQPTALTALVTTPGHGRVDVAEPVVTTREITLTADGGRTWWDLAATHFGDGTKWQDLWDLNEGRVVGDGNVLTSERVVLKPGWTVLIPDDNPPPAIRLATELEPDSAARDSVEVTVRPGDTLSEIAADHGINDWTQLWPFNSGRAEPDGARFINPDYIEPGWTVTIPDPADMGNNGGDATDSGDIGGDNTVAVVAGDTLSQLAADHHIPLEALIAANADRVQPDGARLTDPDDIRPGWFILIPTDVTPGDVTPAEPIVDEPQDADAPAPATQPEPPAVATSVPAIPVPPEFEPDVPPSVGTAPPSTPVEASTRDHGGGDTNAGSRSDSEHSTVLPWFVGAGLLAGGALVALIRHRRRQFRYRAPGRSIRQTPPELLDVERTLLTAGTSGMGDITFLDRALRGLTAAAANGPARLPDVIAARLTTDVLELTLATQNLETPEAWQSNPAGTTWAIRRADVDRSDQYSIHSKFFAPYPTLVSVGYTAAGDQWLLDLEQIGCLTLTGDTERCMDLIRFIAAELAHNGWSDMVDVTLVGFGTDMTSLNPERLTHTDLATALTAANRGLATTADDGDDNRSVLDGRSHPTMAEEVPAPQVTLISPTAARNAAADETLSVLVDQLHDQPDRSAVAIVLAEADTTRDARCDVPFDDEGGWAICVDRDGTLTIPALDLELHANQLPEREAADLAALLALAAATEDQPMPGARGDQPWDEFADAAGNPLPGLTITDKETDATNRVSGSEQVSESSALPLPPRAYLDRTTADQTDIDTLAPRVPGDVRERIENSDTDLDADLADWHDDTTQRPRISVLGPIQVRAQGELPAGRPRLAWHTEVVTYLATRPRGSTVEAFGAAMWPEEPDIAGRPKLRNSIYVARKWLGVDPSTGDEYLPANPRHGGGAYRIIGGLLDAELFRRLRLRGVARGWQGIPDLQAALDLVIGVPFDRQRPGGYGWLVDPALDHEYTAAIVDVAHLVATHHLAAGEPALAADAAKVAILAGSSADTPLLDLVAASDAEGNTAEADAYVKQIMANHEDAEVEEDLPPRTAEILHRRQWLPPAA